MSVWLCIPSKRPPQEAEKVLKLWRQQGYKIALFLDDWRFENRTYDRILSGFTTGGYPGYANAVNALVKDVAYMDSTAEWFIAAGDDVEPDLNHSAEEIAIECSSYFGRINGVYKVECLNFYQDPDLSARGILGRPDSTFGVMQPTGDRWGDSTVSRQRYGQNRGAYIDRVCGSAWIGREFAKRVNQGNGPLWPEYKHQFVDEELQEVATKLGVFWQRPDLIQLHRHWGRGPEAAPNMPGQLERMPEFLKEANSPEHWEKYKTLLEKRKAAGFPGSELLP
jgi:hypothetical protein